MSDQTLHLTDQQVRDGLNKAVEEKGADYRYQSEFDDEQGCVNFVDGKPACIAGNVYAQNGITAAPGSEGFDIWHSSTVGHLTCRREDYYPLTFESDRGKQALAIAQCYQDQGHPWGEARDAALRFLDGDDSVPWWPEHVVDVPEGDE